MKIGIKPLVIGNWKMNPQSLSLGIKLATSIKKKLQPSIADGVEAVIAPPSVYLESVQKLSGGKKGFALGAQTVSHQKLGAYTGEISLLMLGDLGVSYVILGHSERRALGEIDELINQKLISTIKAGLTGVVCIGESKRDHAGLYLSKIEIQVRKAFAGVTRAKLGQVVIAYEPLWAIGTGNTASADDIHEMKIFIERVISDLYGRNLAQKVRIIYGGSVNGKNAQTLHVGGMMDGFLVGGASLHADEFVEILKSVQVS